MHPSHLEKVSIIIPHAGQMSALRPLLEALDCQSEHIAEVIVICSASNKASLIKSLGGQSKSLSAFKKPDADRARVIRFGTLRIVFVRVEVVIYPGHARNLGIQKAKSGIVGFLDSNTIPSSRWLKDSMARLNNNHSDLCLGSTLYHSNCRLGRIILASTYGFKPLSTLPGSLIRHHCLGLVGGFLPNVRAAEDIDFINRLEAFDLNIALSKLPVLSYRLQSNNPFYYIYKWFRNYTSCAPYTSLTLQSFALMLMTSFIAISLAYLWNWNVASWRVDSPLYIPNFTKIILMLFVFAYIAWRGFLLPRSKRAFSKGSCTIFDMPFILIFSFVLDLVKAAAILHRLRYWLGR